MVRRLAYSERGFERAIMMAQASVVAIVEGQCDVYFYQQLLEQYLAERGSDGGYQVRTPKEVEGDADGKKALLKIFRRFREKGQLRISSGGGKDLVFFADRDYDDFSRCALRCPNLIYTPGVTIENSVYATGKLHQSLEAIIGRKIAPGSLLATADFREWRVRCAKAWREWIVYCLMCEITLIAPRKNRGGPSTIHLGDPPELDGNAFSDAVNGIAGRLEDPASVDMYLRRAERSVDRAIQSGFVDKVFCGKWYAFFLKTDVQRLGGAYAQNAGKIVKSGSLLSHLLNGIEFNGEVRDYYFSKLDAIAM